MPSASNSGPKRTLPLSAVKRIDDACDAYEQALAAGTNPRIEDVLAQAPESEAERAALLRDLLALEVDLRLTRGETLTLDDYASRFPGEVAWLRGLLTERTKPLSAAPVPPIGEKLRYFGDYELLDVIARGGMGVVYKARQMKLNRIVALKMILSGRLANDEELRRFKSEAEAAANLEHPDIVPIFEVGEHQGQHYFAMRFIDGQSLAKRVAEGPLPPREAAEMVRRVAEAVQFAHEHGVIHRDLKPGNVLLDSSGNPSVTDFGLAKRVEGDSNLTQSGQILGTPSYMPPEQASGKAQQIGPASDVYSLGAMLYCLVVGRPPFQAATPLETAQQVLRDEPVAPRQLNPAVPRDIETICLKCLNKKSSLRYPTAQSLADELARWLRGEPIHARPTSMLERAWRWTNRHPSAASAIAAVVLGLIAVSILSLELWKSNQDLSTANASLHLANERERQTRERAEDNLQLAFDAVDELFSGFSETRLSNEPRLATVRKKLLEQAIAYFALIGQRSTAQNRRDVRMKLGLSQHGLGMVATTLGDTKDALSKFQAAVVIREQLARELPHDVDAQRHLAITLGMVARTWREEGKPQLARDTYQHAREILEAALRVKPQAPQARRDIAVLLDHMGLLDFNQGQYEAARPNFLQELAQWNILQQEFPNEMAYKSGAVKAAINLASVQHQLGDRSGAIQTLSGAREPLAEMEKAKYAVDETSRETATVEQNFAMLAMEEGQLQVADGAFQKALETNRKLVAPSPTSPLTLDLADTLTNYGLLKVELKQPDQALEYLREARAIWDRCHQSNPGSPRFSFETARTDRRIGEIFLAAKRAVEAQRSFDAALQVLQVILPELPTVKLLQIELPRARLGMANALLAQGQTASVESMLDKASDEVSHLLKDSPNDKQVRFAMADIEETYGKLFGSTAEPERMRNALKKAIATMDSITRDDPNLTVARERLSELRKRLDEM